MTIVATPPRRALHTVADSFTMLRRSIVHARRYPLIAYLIATPVIFLLLFVYVFGGTMGAGLEGLGSGDYLQYVVPGVLLLTLAAGVTGPAVSVSKDMTEGIVARFRTMDISRSAVLTGHVLGNLVQQVLALGIVLGIALLMGFRAPANVWGWLGAAGFLALVGFALCWLGAAFGVFAKGVESASNLPTPLLILPFLGSAFVPTESMPTWLQWFAEYQPFTPFTETLRALLFATPLGASVWLSLAWIVVIGGGGWLWARTLYVRKSLR
jgi:ABC-2 type transport system permease protein